MSKLRSLGRGLERLAKGVIRSPLARAIPGLGQVASVVQTVQEVRKAIPRSAPRAPVSTVSSIRSFENSMAASRSGMLGASPFNRQTIAAGGASMSVVPALARTGGIVARNAGRIARGAGTVAGVAATGAVLYDQFGRPVKGRRRRSKGITARELKSFTRVTGILNKYCKTAPPRRRAAPSRGKACR